jgi:8-oxo-dGTP pyrophosphatase MutT (NUDIX family)
MDVPAISSAMNHTLAEIMTDAELASLRARYGDFPVRTVRIEMGPESLANYRAQLKRRRGEILLVLARPTGEVLIHTKFIYPPGVYRLPTGGIDWNEPVPDAWHRELWEETQLKSSGERFLGVIGYEFVGRTPTGDACVPFVSFVFEERNVRGEPHPLDASEQISDFKWLPRSELRRIAAELEALDSIDGEKGDWGRFRAVAHDFVLEYTTKSNHT